MYERSMYERPSEFPEACRKGTMHTPHEAGTGSALHRAHAIHAREKDSLDPSFRKFWGESNPSPCSHAWGFKHHSSNYKAPTCFLS